MLDFIEFFTSVSARDCDQCSKESEQSRFTTAVVEQFPVDNHQTTDNFIKKRNLVYAEDDNTSRTYPFCYCFQCTIV